MADWKETITDRLPELAAQGATTCVQSVHVASGSLEVSAGTPTSHGLPTVSVAAIATVQVVPPATQSIGAMPTVSVVPPAPTGFGLPTVAVGAIPTLSVVPPQPTSFGLPTVTIANPVTHLAGAPTYYAGRGQATVVASGRVMRAQFTASGIGYWRHSGGASIPLRPNAPVVWEPKATVMNPVVVVGGSVDYFIEAQV